ncbi:hypothetical protein [Acetomicrobium sp.]|uniref:hypothetical protein n=1 Tax=Acetomicrobium sp. TaxID=1872099 RepID=UPI002FC8F57F
MSLAMLMLGLTFLGYGSAAKWAWPSFVASVVLGFLLLRHEHKVSDPILDLDILKRKPFIAPNLYNLIYGGAVVGVLSLIHYVHATAIYDMTPLRVRPASYAQVGGHDNSLGTDQRLHNEVGLSLAAYHRQHRGVVGLYFWAWSLQACSFCTSSCFCWAWVWGCCHRRQTTPALRLLPGRGCYHNGYKRHVSANGRRA